MSRYRCALYFFLSKSFSSENYSALWLVHRRLRVEAHLRDSCTDRDVFADFMCRSHFLVAFVFVGTDFNCFLKSIRRSIPMTVAVKLTSTRRCMTCSFFVTFFMSLSRERSGCVRRGHCAAQSAHCETRQRFRAHYTRDLFRFSFSESSFKFRI